MHYKDNLVSDFVKKSYRLPIHFSFQIFESCTTKLKSFEFQLCSVDVLMRGNFNNVG